MTHEEHVGAALTLLAAQIDQALAFNGKRAHFALLVWTFPDNDERLAAQHTSNTGREGTIEVLRQYADVMQADAITPGPIQRAGQGH